MEELIGLIVPVAIVLFLLALGLFVGGATERRHFRSLTAREEATQSMLVTQLKTFPEIQPGSTAPKAFFAEVVIGADYLKTFLSVFRSIFGGELRSFRSILERARREALMRIKEQAASEGYNALCNVRIETADIGGRGQNRKNKMVMASILASGTAYVTAR